MSTRPTLAATVCVLLAAAQPASAQCLYTFDNAVQYPAGGGRGVDTAIGDMNGDGHPDLVVATDGRQITVLLNAGDGTFGAFSGFSTGASAPDSIVLGDVNNDGDLDAVCAMASSSAVCVLLGDGTGELGAAVPYGTDTGPADAAVADFNGDGRLDIATANHTSQTISLLFNNGDGVFSPPIDLPAGGAAYAILARDLDLDGLTDLVTANDTGSTISVLWGAGAGAFTPPATFAAGPGPFGLDSGDLNGDGAPDIVVASGSSNQFVVLLHQSGRSFAPPVGYPVALGSQVFGVQIGDFNGDSLPDVVALGAGINAFVGDGAGGFTSGPSYPLGSSLTLVAGDLNADDRIDLVAPVFVAQKAAVFLNTSSSYLAPTIVQQPDSVIVQAGDAAAFAVVASTGSGLPLSYQWRRNGLPLSDGGNISGATASELFILSAQPSDIGRYDVVVSIPSCDGGTVNTYSDDAVLAVEGAACPGDFNADGTVNTLDVIAFLNAWAAGC